jgi:hypothetical protein
MKTSELSGKNLDWAVMEAEGNWPKKSPHFHPSVDWNEGGPIIERENISFYPKCSGYGESSTIPTSWFAEKYIHDTLSGRTSKTFLRGGPTPLIAAMRCYVQSKLGDNVNIPEEFQN